VQATEKLYARFKEGSANGLAFDRGLVVRTGLLRWTSASQLLPTAWRVRLPLLGVGVAAGVALALSGLSGGALAGVGAVVATSLLLADSRGTFVDHGTSPATIYHATPAGIYKWADSTTTPTPATVSGPPPFCFVVT
jgi:hypothetical protein